MSEQNQIGGCKTADFTAFLAFLEKTRFFKVAIYLGWMVIYCLRKDRITQLFVLQTSQTVFGTVLKRIFSQRFPDVKMSAEWRWR